MLSAATRKQILRSAKQGVALAMRYFRIPRRAAWVAVLLLCLSAVASGAEYTITDLGVLPGAFSSTATGINLSGQVVGFSSPIGGNPPRAFLYQNGRMTDLGTAPGASDSQGWAINNAGQIAGFSGGRAFLYENGAITSLGVLPGAPGSLAYGINNAGQVVAISGNAAFLYTNGRMTSLGVLPGQNFSEAFAINDLGQVVGRSGGGAFLYTNGQMTELARVPGAQFWVPNAITNAEAVVGTAYLNDGRTLGIVYANGMISSVGLPGVYENYATSINDLGQVVGHAKLSYFGTDLRAFLYEDGSTIDLNTVLPRDSGWTLLAATGINDNT
jgi:probable HAF family extracellular repeat protein